MTQDTVQKSNQSSPFIQLMDVSDSIKFTLSIVVLNQILEESNVMIMEYYILNYSSHKSSVVAVLYF